MSSLDVKLAREALTDHRFYRYRGCAPDLDNPRNAAGNPDLSVDAWFPPDVNGGEDQADRTAREDATIEVCLACPVMVLCDRWASQVDDEGRLAEPHGVAGGRRALERHRMLIASRRRAVSPAMADTTQKRAVLEALAVAADPVAVAGLAGLDVRTANWHRSKLCLLLGLDRESATREELLGAARRHGLLDDRVRVVPDVLPVAAAPTSDGARQRRIRRLHAVQLALLDIELDETTNDDLLESAA